MALVLAAGNPRAETPCDCAETCADAADPSEGLQFDDAAHRHWYAGRFWRGECHSSLFWCFRGDDWYDLTADLLSRAPEAEQPALCRSLFDLGRKIGHEWARDNDIRRISTDDLEAWQDILLNKQSRPEVAIAQTEAAVAERLAAQK